jgi:hypothetical protein
VITLLEDKIRGAICQIENGQTTLAIKTLRETLQILENTRTDDDLDLSELE